MTMRTFTHLYDSYDDAMQTFKALEAAGIPRDDISLVANNATSQHVLDRPDYDRVAAAPATGTGATVGGLVGGGTGLAVGLGMLAIPGVGPVVAAGWLVATLAGAGAGAVGGGLLGSLVHSGVPDEHAHVYAEGVRRGGTLVTVRADESRAAQVEAVLDGRLTEAVDVGARRTEYQQAAWSMHEPTGPAYTADQVAAERARRL